MKRPLVILSVFVLLFPIAGKAVTYLHVNGVSDYTITVLPSNPVMECDLAQAGNKVTWEVYVDVNFNGVLDALDQVVEFLVYTDGIGWIKDPNDSDNDIPGDETGADGTIKVTYKLQREDILPARFQAILKVVDEDASTAQAIVRIEVAPVPPYITGKVTDVLTGLPIPNAVVMGMNLSDSSAAASAITGSDGSYTLQLSAGEWALVAGTFFFQSNYQASDTLSLSIGAAEIKTQDFALKPFESFLEGSVKKLSGAPLAGLLITAFTLDDRTTNSGMTDENGEYRIGISPGQVVVSCSPLLNMAVAGDVWPEGFYADPEVDTLALSPGQTARRNFILKPYESSITGVCTLDGQGISGVTITGISIDQQTYSMAIYSTKTKSDGAYRLGVHSGIVATLNAYKEKHTVDPMFGYQNIMLLPGQTKTDYNFTLSAADFYASFSGKVTYDGGSAASDVYVVAYAENMLNANGFRIQYTDQNGEYAFQNLDADGWRIGVYKSVHTSDPAMYVEDIWGGGDLTGRDFVLMQGSAVEPGESRSLPDEFRVLQNYPNPFNPATKIIFSLPEGAFVTVRVFNVTGQLVATLLDATLEAGMHTARWDGRNAAGINVPSGAYFYQVTTPEQTFIHKMLLVR